MIPGRLTIAAMAGCAILAPLAAWSTWSAVTTAAAKAEVVKDRDKLDKALNAPVVGVRAQLTACQNSRLALEDGLRRQNLKVEALQAAATTAQAQAQAAIDAAQARARSAERRVQSLLTAQPNAGETRCEAADRLIQETIR